MKNEALKDSVVQDRLINDSILDEEAAVAGENRRNGDESKTGATAAMASKSMMVMSRKAAAADG